MIQINLSISGFCTITDLIAAYHNYPEDFCVLRMYDEGFRILSFPQEVKDVLSKESLDQFFKAQKRTFRISEEEISKLPTDTVVGFELTISDFNRSKYISGAIGEYDHIPLVHALLEWALGHYVSKKMPDRLKSWEAATGEEPFYEENGYCCNFRLRDYWRWKFRNFSLWDESREMSLFLIAAALDWVESYTTKEWEPADQDKQIEKWESYGIIYQEKRIAVLTSSDFQWREKTAISDGGMFKFMEAPSSLKSDLYVFCHHMGENFKSSYPLDLSHWEFYVIPAKIVEENFNEKDSVSLCEIQSITKSIPFKSIKQTIKSILFSSRRKR